MPTSPEGPRPAAPPPPPDRQKLAAASLRLPAEALRGECDETFFIASGPGGQHRNKTESGVRLVHQPTGLVVTATERRSQAQNREAALERLREALAALAFVPRVRKATRPTRGSQRRRLEAKKRLAEKKQQRRGDY